ncbi:MAG: histidine phosphatase family protein [Rhodospirillaceae bacterium]
MASLSVSLPHRPNTVLAVLFALALAMISALAPGQAQAQSLAQTQSAAPGDLLRALQQGGLVVYFRHAATTWSGVDSIDWPRERQRLLSEQGIKDSKAIGAAIKAMGIPVGEVIASPFARCRDMAEIAFGRVEERDELLGLLSDRDGHPARIAYMRDRVSSLTQPGLNRMIVAHRSNIAAVADVSLREGEAVVLRPLGGGRFDVLGTLAPEDWSPDLL